MCSARIEPCLQKQTCSYHIDFAPHSPLVEPLFTQITFRLDRAQAFVCEFHGYACELGNLFCNYANALDLGPFFARKGKRQTAQEHLGLPVLEQALERLRPAAHLGGGEHGDRRRDALAGIAYRDADSFLTYVERHDSHGGSIPECAGSPDADRVFSRWSIDE